jgi:hypothetical protein
MEKILIGMNFKKRIFYFYKKKDFKRKKDYFKGLKEFKG